MPPTSLGSRVTFQLTLVWSKVAGAFIAVRAKITSGGMISGESENNGVQVKRAGCKNDCGAAERAEGRRTSTGGYHGEDVPVAVEFRDGGPGVIVTSLRR